MRSRSEFTLQRSIVNMIKADYPLFRVSAIPNGGYRNEIEGRNLKIMGVLAGEPDLILRLPGGVTWNLEIKTERGKQNAAQKRCQADCERLDHKYYVITSLKQISEMLYNEYRVYFRRT